MRLSPAIRWWWGWGLHRCATQWRSLLLALSLTPAVLVVISIIVVAALTTGPVYSSGAWYRSRAAGAMAAGDFATARLCYASLLQQSPTNLAYQYGLANSLYGLGQQAAAATLIRQLTPEDAPGYLPAQIEVARQSLSGSSLTPEALRSAEARLQQVLKLHPKDPEAHVLLAQLYAKSERWDLVQQHMAFGGAVADEWALPAALAFSQRGDQGECEILARRAAAYYAPRVQADPKDETCRLNYAQATLLLRDFEKTLEILDAGWQQGKQPIFRKTVAHVCSLWLRESPSMTPSRRLLLLENGLTWDSQNAALLQILLDPATALDAGNVEPTTSPVQGAAVRALAQAVADCRKSQADKARSELELALNAGGPEMVSIAGNVASHWAYSKAADASCALSLSTLLLELRPAEPLAQRAQGMVLAQQEKTSQALPYLETAGAAMPQDLGIHTALASIYEKLGEPELAERHRKLAQPATAPTTGPAAAAKPTGK